MSELSFSELFGRVIKRERIKMGLSQEEFANLCGLHRTYIGPIERGEKNITLETARKLANGLGIRIADIFQEIEE